MDNNYQRKPVQVYAEQWKGWGDKDCTLSNNFTTWGCLDVDDDSICPICGHPMKCHALSAHTTVHPYDWVVQEEGKGLQIMKDTEFYDKYERYYPPLLNAPDDFARLTLDPLPLLILKRECK